MYKLIIFIQLCAMCAIISSTDASLWDGLVNIDRADNGDRKVGVHVPFFYWMDLNRNKKGQPKLDISVLGGFVKVNVDRSLNSEGKRPVMVRLLGQKIYNSYPEGVVPANAAILKPFGINQYQGDESQEVIAFKPNVYKPVESIVAQESVNTETSKINEPSSSPTSSPISYDASVTQETVAAN